MPNHEILIDTKRGQIITAKKMTRISRAINANTSAIQTPREVLQPNDITEETEGGGVGNETFNSTSGTETTVTATDSAGDTLDVERVDTVVFTESTSGRTMTLNLTYPL